MKCFPDKKYLLYGEDKLNKEAINEYDFIFMPSFVIKNLPSDSVDIFINLSSLGEMNPETCQMFVHEICRTANAFWHINHEFQRNKFGNGKSSLINRAYPVSDEKFDLVTRFPEATNAAYKGFFDKWNDYYCYLYKAKMNLDS